MFLDIMIIIFTLNIFHLKIQSVLSKQILFLIYIYYAVHGWRLHILMHLITHIFAHISASNIILISPVHFIFNLNIKFILNEFNLI